MRNSDKWQPTKFVKSKGQLRATSDRDKLNVSSRLIADMVAEEYDRAFERYASGRLLDLGCGEAPLFEAYQPWVSEVQCVDWEKSGHADDYVDKACDLGSTLPYEDGSFETIVLSDVLEHLSDPMICWREMNRVLVGDGKVLLNVPFYYPLHEEPYDFYRYTQFALRRFAELCGFAVVELKSLGGPIEVWADITGKMLSASKLRGPAALVQSAARRLGRSSFGKRINRRTNDRFPLGYFMVAVKQRSLGPA